MNAAERLKKLLLMLSSSQDGEVVNAARAIGRALQASGKDWHDLARRLSAPARVNTAEQAPPRQNNNTDWRVMREYCVQHDDRLRPREREFLDNLASWRGDLTEKQRSWLTAIYQRLGGTNK
jgi:hypothetical protein